MATPILRVQVVVVGDAAIADGFLDEMELATGLRGERNAKGRVYEIEDRGMASVSDRIVAHLSKGWQDHIAFEE